MAAAAITASKSGGQEARFALQEQFLETIIVDDEDTKTALAGWMRARGAGRRETIWFRDAEVAEAVDAILFIGLAPYWYPPNYDCGACGYATAPSSSTASPSFAETPTSSNSPVRAATCATSTAAARPG